MELARPELVEEVAAEAGNRVYSMMYKFLRIGSV
jgi:hypothetical protein